MEKPPCVGVCTNTKQNRSACVYVYVCVHALVRPRYLCELFCWEHRPWPVLDKSVAGKRGARCAHSCKSFITFHTKAATRKANRSKKDKVCFARDCANCSHTHV